LVERAAAISAALGGVGNIVQIEPCTLTRLRVELRDGRPIRQADLVAAGALGLLRVSEHLVHVIVLQKGPTGRACSRLSRRLFSDSPCTHAFRHVTATSPWPYLPVGGCNETSDLADSAYGRRGARADGDFTRYAPLS
jgi:PTS system N-acetylglucosamine-specific IIB component